MSSSSSASSSSSSASARPDLPGLSGPSTLKNVRFVMEGVVYAIDADSCYSHIDSIAYCMVVNEGKVAASTAQAHQPFGLDMPSAVGNVIRDAAMRRLAGAGVSIQMDGNMRVKSSELDKHPKIKEFREDSWKFADSITEKGMSYVVAVEFEDSIGLFSCSLNSMFRVHSRHNSRLTERAATKDMFAKFTAAVGIPLSEVIPNLAATDVDSVLGEQVSVQSSDSRSYLGSIRFDAAGSGDREADSPDLLRAAETIKVVVEALESISKRHSTSNACIQAGLRHGVVALGEIAKSKVSVYYCGRITEHLSWAFSFCLGYLAVDGQKSKHIDAYKTMSATRYKHYKSAIGGASVADALIKGYNKTAKASDSFGAIARVLSNALKVAAGYAEARKKLGKKTKDDEISGGEEKAFYEGVTYVLDDTELMMLIIEMQGDLESSLRMMGF